MRLIYAVHIRSCCVLVEMLRDVKSYVVIMNDIKANKDDFMIFCGGTALILHLILQVKVLHCSLGKRYQRTASLSHESSAPFNYK